MRKSVTVAMIASSVLVGTAAFAGTSVGPVTFEPDQGFHTGSIDGQQGWSQQGQQLDSVVDSVSNFPNASGFGFQSQALRLSNGKTSGAFGDQTFSPAASPAAGELTGSNHFDATFSIGSTQGSVQPGMFTSISPDDGVGDRMSWVGLADQNDGIHVQFETATDPGPVGTVANFQVKDIAKIDRTHAHTIRITIDFKPGPKNDVVKVYVDGALKVTGPSWEDYYRYDPEQAGNGNVVHPVFDLEFREGGTAVPANLGHGYLFDNVSIATSNSGSTTYCGTNLPDGTYTDVVVPSGATCTLDSGVTVTDDVTVQKNGTLIDQGATVDQDIRADHPAGIGIYAHPYIGHNIQIDGVTGNSGDGFNYICSSTVGNDVVVQNSAASAAPWSIGGSDCGLGNRPPDGGIGHNLVVQKNANQVDVSRNAVANDMTVSGNTGGVIVTDNSAGHDANCSGNTPPTTISGNTAGHNNTCTG